jgi:DNA polymerase-3 subunit gamma/tau
MRDALSLLDQCIAYGEGSVSEHHVNLLLGGISEEKIAFLLDKIHTYQTQAILDLINEFEENGVDFFILLDKILSYLQKIAVLHFTQSSAPETEKFTPEEIQLYYQITLLGKRDLCLAPDPKSGFIMIAIRMAAFRPADLKEKAVVESAHPVSTPSYTVKDNARPPEETATLRAAATPLDWTDIVNQLTLSGLAKILAQNCVLSQMDHETIELRLDPAHSALLTDMAKERLKQALCAYYQKPYGLFISIGKPEAETPAQQKNRAIAEKNHARETTLFSDKTVQSLIQTFSATVVADSITDSEE